MDSHLHDVVIIGAGWSGLLACKYALEEGLRPLVLEAREDLGGVWNFTADPSTVTVLKTTRTSSSATVTEFSDFPMPRAMGSFPHHSQVKAYLQAYAERYGLLSHIRFGSPVRHTDKSEAGEWVTETMGGEVHRSKNLIVCTGTHQRPNALLEELAGFTGTRLHSGDIKEVGERFRGQRVLVIGGGETSSDVVGELSKGGAKGIAWSIPRGQQFFRKRAVLTHLEGLFSLFTKKSSRLTLDEAGSVAMRALIPFRAGKPGMSWVCNLSTSGSPFAYNGHGIPAWRTEAPPWRSFYNKQAHVLDLVHAGTVTPHGAISHAEGRFVHFTDGSRVEVDVTVEATGYHHDFAFLPARHRRCMSSRYKLVMDPDDPTLLFIGFARPIVTSIPMMTEIQAMAFLPMVSGRLPRPSRETMRREAEADAAERAEYFKFTSNRIKSLVEPIRYFEDLLSLSGRKPDLAALFREDPVAALKVCFAPPHTAYARVAGRDRKQAVAQLAERTEATWYVVPPIFALVRFSGLYRLFERLEALRYELQIASRKHRVLGAVRDHGLLRRARSFYRDRLLDCERPFGRKYSELDEGDASA